MNKATQYSPLSKHFSTLFVSLLVLLFSWPAHATVNHFFIEHNFALTLGMVIPVLLVLALLKPIAPIAIRYPFILSIALMVKLYALHYLSENQTNVLLLSAGAFISAILLATVIEKISGKKQRLFATLVGVLYMLFVAVILLANGVSVDIMWLGASVFILLAAAVGYFMLKNSLLIHWKQELFLWALVVLYSISVYLWLINKIPELWQVATAVIIYLLFVANYCRNIVRQDLVHMPSSSDNHTAQKNEENILDPITNLPSYHHALSRLCQYNNKKNSLAIIVFKPINFAQMNKVLGHHNSDILLLQLAYCLQKELASNELLVNFSTEESPTRLARTQGLDFVVALNSAESQHPAKLLVEQLCQQLKLAVPKAMSFKSFSLNFELKFGVAFADEHQNNLEQTIAFAGDALLEAEQGHQLVSYFAQEATLYTEEKLLVMEQLKQDVLSNELRWLVKPQISLCESRLIGFELFTDWRSSNGNKLDVNEFIELAEYSGDIYALTRQIIEQACQLISLLHRENFHIQVSINLSSKAVLEPELSEFIEQISDKYQTALRYLVIEIDETLLFDGDNKAKKMIDQLKSIGVLVSINNFSGSYEALKYLRRLSIDQVKVDCSHLIGSFHTNHSEKIIINALISLIRTMKIPLIASGINNSEIKGTYLDIGGDIGQGSLINDGICVNEAKAWTEQWLSQQISPH